MAQHYLFASSMILSSLLPALGAFLVGMLWRSGFPFADIATLAIPILWALSTSRLSATAVWFVYVMVIGFDVGEGAEMLQPGAGWFDWLSVLPGLALFCALPWAVLWQREWTAISLSWRTVAAWAIYTTPPIGVFALCNPMLSAGSLFPGMGFVGMGLTMAGLILVMLWLLQPRHPVPLPALFTLVFVSVLANLLVTGSPVTNNPQWVGVHSTHGKPADSDDIESIARETAWAVAAIEAAMDQGAALVVLPENTTTLLHPVQSIGWKVAALTHRKNPGWDLLVGAVKPVDEQHFLHGAALLSATSDTWISSRVPMPGGIWSITGPSAETDWYASRVIELQGKKVAISICYEEYLLFPNMMNMIYRPDAMINLSNNWVFQEPMVWRQTFHAEKIARLFHLPMTRALAR